MVDLEAKQIRAGDIVADFVIDDYVRWRLLEGLDDIGITMQHADAITRFERDRPSIPPPPRSWELPPLPGPSGLLTGEFAARESHDS